MAANQNSIERGHKWPRIALDQDGTNLSKKDPALLKMWDPQGLAKKVHSFYQIKNLAKLFDLKSIERKLKPGLIFVFVMNKRLFCRCLYANYFPSCFPFLCQT